jgi:hypothetical protein
MIGDSLRCWTSPTEISAAASRMRIVLIIGYSCPVPSLDVGSKHAYSQQNARASPEQKESYLESDPGTSAPAHPKDPEQKIRPELNSQCV